MAFRVYSEDEKQQALDVLEAVGGDLTRARLQTGIQNRTLLRWQQKYRPTLTVSKSKMPTPTSQAPSPVVLSADDEAALRNLQRGMMEEANRLVQSIAPAIHDAPLAQRVIALARLIDRIIKLSAQLAAEEEEEVIYRIADSEGQEPDDETDEDREAD